MLIKIWCVMYYELWHTVFGKQANGNIYKIHQQLYAGQEQHPDSQGAASNVRKIFRGQLMCVCACVCVHA